MLCIQSEPSVFCVKNSGTSNRRPGLFFGKGVTEQEIVLAKQISLEIPAPFMRIDFLRGERGLVLNEFTPRPGVIGYFNEKRDSLYGRMYHEADSRLLNDLLSGKRFEAFHNATRGSQGT